MSRVVPQHLGLRNVEANESEEPLGLAVWEPARESQTEGDAEIAGHAQLVQPREHFEQEVTVDQVRVDHGGGGLLDRDHLSVGVQQGSDPVFAI